LKVKVKYTGNIEKDGESRPVFIGQATIDRTQFGMSPDSKEGNVVTFDFSIELKKVEKKKEEKTEKKAEPKKTEKKKTSKKKDNRSARSRRNSD
jgi:hypothetical protein